PDVGWRARIVGARAVVELTQGPLVAAVVDLEEDLAVAPAQVDWLQDVEIGGVLHHPAGVAGRLVEVHDQGVARIVRIHLEVGRTDELLAAAAAPEGHAPGEWLAASKFDAGDVG